MKTTIISLIIITIFCSCSELEDVESYGSWGFSPNGDGINDLFILSKNDIKFDKMTILFDTTKINKMTIFETRTNNIVYKGVQYHRNWWNGRKNNCGGVVPIGLYDFYLELEGEKIYFGNVYVKY